MSVSFVLVGSQIKRFKTVVKSLAAIGSELLVEALPEKLILRAINSAHSAFLAVSLTSHFFESYNVFSQTGVVQAGILIKHMLATFRSTRVQSMSCELNEQLSSLKVTLRCDNGLLKRYGLDINSTDILQANLDGSGLPVSVVAEASELNKLLNTFQSTLDEVSIIALPAQQSTAGTGGQAAAQRCVKLQSFYDPAKAAGSKALHTSMSLDTSSVFKSYSNSASSPSDVTINLKDLKALVGLCSELGADVLLKFDEAGVPLTAQPHAPGVTAMDLSAELILSTLQESVHRAEDEDDAWQQQDQQPAAAAGNGAPNGVPAAAEPAETIAPATTFRGVGGRTAAAAAGAETPQGGVPPGRGAGSGSVLRFRQTTAASNAAAAAAGGVSGSGGFSGGGRSGGCSRSGGISRFEQMQAALAEEEEQQQEQQQYRQQFHQQQQQQQQYSHGMGPPAPIPAASGDAAGFDTPASRMQQQSRPQQRAPAYQQYQQQQQQQQQQPAWVGGGHASQDFGQGTFESSMDDVEMLPRQRPRSPAPAAAAAAAAAAGCDHLRQQQQQQQQEHQPWGQFNQQPQQQQQQQGYAAAEGVQGGYGDMMDGVDDDDEELGLTQSQAESERDEDL